MVWTLPRVAVRGEFVMKSQAFLGAKGRNRRSNKLLDGKGPSSDAKLQKFAVYRTLKKKAANGEPGNKHRGGPGEV